MRKTTATKKTSSNGKKATKKAKPLSGTRNSSEYNHAYYLAHKNDKKFRERRLRNGRNRRRNQTKADRERRNAYLRKRWANDPAFREHSLAYQKAYRERKKRAAKRLAKKNSR